MDGLWVPGLAVLAAGLVGGWWAARRLAAGGGEPKRDLELAIADLEARRDQIYAQLRGQGGEPPSGADRRQLELSAARTLKELEEKRAALAPARGRKKKKKRAPAARARAGAEGASEPLEAPPPAAAAPAGGFAARHPLVAGFALGAGMVAVVGVLIYWAVRDARPQAAGPVAGSAPPPVAGGLSPEEAHDEAGELPITLRVELDALDERLAADPGDLAARRERALFLLGIERYVEAFEDASALLAANPQDIDGLYVQGVVRLTMGQDDEALRLFDRVLELFPDHARALVWRDILVFRGGDRDGALASWRRALEISGGSQPEIEELIRAAEQAPGAPGAAAAPVTAAAPPPGPASPPAVGPGAFGIRVTLADGAFPPPGGVLFISLRPAGGGPPVAVKRVDRVARFPVDLTLDASDSMMGQELPANGIVRVRIDADGSASTRSPEDLEAEVEARQGATVSLVLGGP